MLSNRHFRDEGEKGGEVGAFDSLFCLIVLLDREYVLQGWFVEHRFFEGEGETLALIDRWTSSWEFILFLSKVFCFGQHVSKG